MNKETNNQPVHKVRFGCIEVTSWENVSENGEAFFSFVLRRSYKDQNGNWHEQKISLRRNDLMKAVGALTQAHADFYTLPQFQKGAETEASADEAA
ncbi:MAG: hypothetical protein AAF591_14450 [Verrucomicrobiota bacterium]